MYSILPAAQNAGDRDAVMNLVNGFDTAWNKHDMSAFGTLFADDAEFVNVVGMWWRGRDAIQAAHTHTHATFLKDSVLEWNVASLKFLAPDVALVHVEWRMTGHREPSGAIGMPRKGILVLVTVKSAIGWRIAAGQNTNDVLEAMALMRRG